MDDSWIAQARAAAKRAYAPYSKFNVGAVVVDERGRTVSGCNVENASFGLSICAERVALFGAANQGLGKIEHLVLYTPTQEPSSPCGACRQVLQELAPEATVSCVCDGPEQRTYSAAELLPMAFELDAK